MGDHMEEKPVSSFFSFYRYSDYNHIDITVTITVPLERKEPRGKKFTKSFAFYNCLIYIYIYFRGEGSVLEIMAFMTCVFVLDWGWGVVLE